MPETLPQGVESLPNKLVLQRWVNELEKNLLLGTASLHTLGNVGHNRKGLKLQPPQKVVADDDRHQRGTPSNPT